MKCPKCQMDNVEGARFCMSCRTPLQRKMCPSGHVIPAGTDYCPICRTAAGLVAPAPPPPAGAPGPGPGGGVGLAPKRKTMVEGAEPAYAPPAAPPQGPPVPPFAPNHAAQIPLQPMWGPQRPGQAAPDAASPKRKTVIEGAEPSSPGPVMPANPYPQAPPAPAAPCASPKRKTIIEGADPVPPASTGTAAAAAAPASAPQARPGMRIVGWLITYSQRKEGLDFRLYEGRNIIGASPDCDIFVHDPAFSSEHAILLYRRGRYVIEDRLSTNGTFVNGEEVVHPRELFAYDEIRMGDTVFTFISSFKPGSVQS